MYKSFYNFVKKPFQISSDPSFIWLGENHKEALATLKYGVLDNKGFLLLTGDVGTGKTTLINCLISSLTDRVIYASVPDPCLEKLDFLNYIADAFGINQEFTSKGKFVKAFSQFLREAYEQEKSVLLVIDEAQLLTQELLEEVRLLSNINIDNSTILSIFFVGQDEFNEVISRPENRAVYHRLTLNHNLSPLDLEQTSQYIKHRLKIAGATEEIFNPSAIRVIYDYSDGLPRRINIACDHCLITGYVDGKKVIDERDALNCIRELSIPTYSNSVSYHNSGQLLASELYIPAKELLQSESQDESSHDYLPEENTNNDDSGGKEIDPDQDQSDKKPAWLNWASIIPLSIIVFFILYLLLPESNIETSVSTIRQKSSPTSEKKLNEPESERIAAPITIANTEELPSAQVEETSRPNISVEAESVNLPTIQDEANESITETNAEDNYEIEKQPTPQPDSVVSTTSPEDSADTNFPQETVETEETLSFLSYDEDLDYYRNDSGGYLPTTIVSGFVNPPEKPEKYDSISEKEVHISPKPDQLLTIRFDRNSVHFNALDYELIDSYVDYLTNSPATTATIAGYTDSSGTADYNYLISKYRAEIVKSYFIGRGISDSQLRVIGFGPRKPLAENDTEEGRELNRRVEVSILSKEQN